MQAIARPSRIVGAGTPSLAHGRIVGNFVEDDAHQKDADDQGTSGQGEQSAELIHQGIPRAKRA